MTLKEKQDKARKEFIQNWFNDELILANFNNRDLIIETGDKDVPYIKLSITALTDEQGDNQIIELNEKQKIFEDMLDKRRLRKLCEMFNIR
jgi:hypothetical protein